MQSISNVLVPTNKTFNRFISGQCIEAIILVVQQREEKLIYPRLLGASSVGLSPLWMFLAITLSGSLFGVVEMLIALPLASVTYAVIKGNVDKKVK